MNVPQDPNQHASLELRYEEIIHLKSAIEEAFQVEITDEKLGKAIKSTNQERAALKELYDLNRNKPALLSGLDLLKVSFQIAFQADREERITLLNNLIAEIKEMAEKGYYAGTPSSPRILLTGTPVGLGSEKVITLVEE